MAADATYRVLCADLVSNTIREELPIHDLEWSVGLNMPGAFSGWISMDDTKCTRANLDPAATAIYIERGGLLVWGGILWTAQADTDDRKVQLGAEGFLSYFRRRRIKNRTGMTHSTTGNVDTYFPTADANATSNLLAGPDGANFWANVNHKNWNPIQAITQNDTGNPFEYEANLGDIQSGFYQGLTIVGLRLTLVGTCSPAKADLFPAVRIGGTTYTGTAGTLRPSKSTITYTFATNPATGLAWTGSDIEAFASSSGAGFKCAGGTTAFDHQINNIWVEVIWGAHNTPVFLGVDQLSIAQDLITNAMVQPGSLTGITVGTELTTDNNGVQQVRDREYHPYERKNVGEALDQLAAIQNGFDYSIEVTWDSTGLIPQRRLALYYPRRGRRIDGLVFNHNITGTSKVGVDVDGTRAVNSWDVLGSGDGDNMLIASASDSSVFSRYPLLEDVGSAKDIIEQTTLQAQAAANLAATRLPVETPSIEKQASTWPDLGSFQPGDEGLVVASDGWISMNSYQRVQLIEVKVSDEGQETMTPTFVSADITF